MKEELMIGGQEYVDLRKFNSNLKKKLEIKDRRTLASEKVAKIEKLKNSENLWRLIEQEYVGKTLELVGVLGSADTKLQAKQILNSRHLTDLAPIQHSELRNNELKLTSLKLAPFTII